MIFQRKNCFTFFARDSDAAYGAARSF